MITQLAAGTFGIVCAIFYILIGYGIGSFLMRDSTDKTNMIWSIIFWPVCILGGITWSIANLIGRILRIV